MRTRHFTDLLVWQRSMGLARTIYKITELFPKHEMFGLTSQIRRAAISVPSNIAEGHGRLSDKLFRVFLAQARGSLFEVQTQIMLACDLGYLELERLRPLLSECSEITMMLNGLLKSLKKERAKAQR